jgi:hypothetical protein
LWAEQLATDFPSFCAALGGQEAVAALPVLDLGGRGGTTDYIDFLKPEELAAPVMIGTDAWRRKFVAFRLKVEGKRDMVMTLFERYSDDHSTWSCGTRGDRRICDQLVGSGHCRPETMDNMHALLKDRSLALTEWTLTL